MATEQRSPEDEPGTDDGDDEDGFDDDDGFRPYSHPPRSVTLINDALDQFYEAFQETFTEYDDMDPREGFTQHMIDLGVVFPGPTREFGEVNEDPGKYGIISGGQAGATTASTRLALDFNANLSDGIHDRRHGWMLSTRAVRNPILRIVDTEDVADRVDGAAPDDAGEFVEAMLAQFDYVDERGSGNDVIQGLRNLLQRPDFLAWFIEALTIEGASVKEVIAGLGGGTGTALDVLAADWARMGIIGMDDQSLGFTTTAQLGRSQNDVKLGTFDDGTERTTWHDALAAEWFNAKQVYDGNADWWLLMDNLALTYAFFGLRDNPDLDHTRRFWGPVRNGGAPAKVEKRIVRELPRDVDDDDFELNDHFTRNLVFSRATWPFVRLQQRDAAVEFNVGRETYDDTDFRTDFHGHVLTPAFDGVNSWDEFDNRNIPRFDGVNGHKDALHAISHTAAALPTSFVSFDEMYGALPVVYAPGMDIGLDELDLIEEEVANELKLSSGDVRAVNMEGIPPERFPGNHSLALSVYIKTTAPVNAHYEMASDEYARRVNGGD